MKKLFTVAEVADLTGYTVGTIREYARIGEIEADKYGNSWRFTEEQIKEFLDKKKKRGSNDKS